LHFISPPLVGFDGLDKVAVAEADGIDVVAVATSTEAFHFVHRISIVVFSCNVEADVHHGLYVVRVHAEHGFLLSGVARH
jgi:hypothetical protein